MQPYLILYTEQILRKKHLFYGWLICPWVWSIQQQQQQQEMCPAERQREEPAENKASYTEVINPNEDIYITVWHTRTGNILDITSKHTSAYMKLHESNCYLYIVCDNILYFCHYEQGCMYIFFYLQIQHTFNNTYLWIGIYFT